MSKAGIGRGRGWLNLNKTHDNASNTNRVGNNVPVSCQNSCNENEFADAKDDFQDLINNVKQLNMNDDGILFNQKVKYILENWNEDCPTPEHVEKSFNHLFKQCLNDTELTLKLVQLVSSRSFISQKIHDKNIRILFLKELQDNFGAMQMQKSNPAAFRNSVRLMGDFYYKARLSSGKQMVFLKRPLLSYMEMLLEPSSLENIQLFTMQLYQNGGSLKADDNEKMTEILNSIRLLLASDQDLSKETKLWLLLSLDIANNRFGMLPTELHKFYQEHLGDTAMCGFQVANTALSVQTDQDNVTLDNYQSNVNVLQVSSQSNETPSDGSSWSSLTIGHNNPPANTVNISNFRPSSLTSNNSGAQREVAANSVKYGRPILGAGARLNKPKVEGSADNKTNWREKDKSNSGWGDSAKKSDKGWEHDDRHENDYS